MLTSFFIGLVVIIDGYLLIKSHGVMKLGTLSSITTGVEFLWAIASVIALFQYDFNKAQLLVPVVYLIHNILGWLYGFWLEFKSPTENIKEIFAPVWYAKLSVIFGVTFTILCAFILLQMYS